MSHDEFDVRAALTDWYTAMTAHDITAVGEALTESFLLIEHDDLLDRSQLLEMLSSETDDDLIAALTDFHVTVQGDVAWSTHRNHEVYTPAVGEQLQLEFLETVVLVRRDGRWLIDRYHATRLFPATM
jgi:ketosteroid isomerase-like protein